MSKPLKPEQVRAALRFYAIALGPPGKPKPWPDFKTPAAPPLTAPPINPEPKDRP
jgi:hypothetical protein